MRNNPIPVTLLTGYLGSGKTTLLNHILNNKKGLKFAVIVNDIGEVNIDETLIQKGGIVSSKDDSLVPLQNGCICCTLKEDLIKQLSDIAETNKFDYIVIEASGICEPVPIAQTITSMSDMARKYGMPDICRLDAVVTVVDALRMAQEFGCGSELVKENIDEEDIENLVIQQIEFCDVILLNKVSLVSPEELAKLKVVIKTLQPNAEIIDTDFCNVDVERIVNCKRFNFEKAVLSAGWIAELDRPIEEDEEEEHEHHHHHHHDHEHDEHEHHHHDGDDDDDVCPHCGHHHDHDHECEHDHEHHHHDHDEHEHHHDGHCHCHCHHHHHEGGEVEEYGIGTFVYFCRDPFNRNKFIDWASKKWDRSIIRCKGVVYFADETNMSYLFEQAGTQKNLQESGLWIASAPKEEQDNILADNPDMLKEWKEPYGDRMEKLVFIGQKMNKEEICNALDACLLKTDKF
ncbi:MAG: GTP-binding protein [Paludibacteraceae bacterium]|nr:GTP-binding protein [Paludibacteraceae bacterium]